MFFKFKNNNDELVHVLDFLLQVALNGEEIDKHRNIDLEFYNLLNRVDINQDVIHLGLIPVSREKKSMEQDYSDFIHNLSMYIEFDLNSDFVWAHTYRDNDKHSQYLEAVTNTKLSSLKYLLAKEAITQEEFKNHASRGVKDIYQ